VCIYVRIYVFVGAERDLGGKKKGQQDEEDQQDEEQDEEKDEEQDEDQQDDRQEKETPPKPTVKKWEIKAAKQYYYKFPSGMSESECSEKTQG